MWGYKDDLVLGGAPDFLEQSVEEEREGKHSCRTMQPQGATEHKGGACNPACAVQHGQGVEVTPGSEL